MNIREIARKLNVSKSTVSLALRNDVSISVSTCRRIRAYARKIGYKRDPTLVRVMSAISRHTPDITSAIAVLSGWPTPRHWENNLWLERYYRGIVGRANELGYHVDEMWTRAPGMTPRRVCQILEARGTEGVIVFPWPSVPARLNMDLSPYGCAAIGVAPTHPRCFTVDHDHFQAIAECLRQLSRRGYMRPALLLNQEAHDRTLHRWVAAYQYFYAQLPPRQRIPFWLVTRRDDRSVARWIRQHRPDAVIISEFSMLEHLQNAGFVVPRDFGVAVLFWRNATQGLAGIDIQDEVIASRAVDLVVGQIHNHRQRLAPARPETILVDGIWRDGASLPPRK